MLLYDLIIKAAVPAIIIGYGICIKAVIGIIEERVELQLAAFGIHLDSAVVTVKSYLVFQRPGENAESAILRVLYAYALQGIKPEAERIWRSQGAHQDGNELI